MNKRRVAALRQPYKGSSILTLDPLNDKKERRFLSAPFWNCRDVARNVSTGMYYRFTIFRMVTPCGTVIRSV